jgi:hypothetical protein
MNIFSKVCLWGGCVGAALCGSAAAQTASSACDQAWADYNEFKRNNVMEPSQYAVTVHGAAVRAACGQEALPAPPGTDVAPHPHLRKPPPKPLPSRPAAPQKPTMPGTTLNR